MKVVDEILPISVSSNDVLCPTGQDHDSDNQKSHHDGPEENHEDKSASFPQHPD